MSRRSSTASERGRALHLDAFSGVAGNMFLGALLDAGLARRDLAADLAGLDLPHTLRVSKVARGAIAARYVRVGVPKPAAAKAAKKGGKRAAGRAKTARGHAHGHGRHYRDIVAVIRKARLDTSVRDRALAIFEALGHAEAKVHGTRLEAVHFHEVGAVDAIVDVTGAAIGLARLGVTRVTCSPVALGSGHVETAHGRLPLPAPATLELLRGIPTEPAHVAWETVTPTGAAILRTVVDEYGPLPALTVERIGYGAGDDREGPMPNVLRAVLGRSGGLRADRIVALETNLDDLVPEHFDYLLERLQQAGALDVSIQHVQMKKNRPGFLVRVLAKPADRDALARVLFAESTAIGVRTQAFDRLLLEREVRRVETPYGRLRVKVVRDADGAPDVSAEYDDCRRAARRTGVPLRQIVRVAEEVARGELA